jgi:hypothetical protein
MATNAILVDLPLGQGISLVREDGTFQLGIVGTSGGSVTSVFGRTGAVVAQTGDYTVGQLAQSGATTGQTITWNGTAWVPSGLDVSQLTPGAGGTILASNGTVASWQPALTAPANPGDTGKVVIANAGNFSYLAGGVTGQALTWSGTAWAAGTDFGANLVTNSGGVQTTGAVGSSFVAIGLSATGAGNAATTGNLRIQQGFTCKFRLAGGGDSTIWDVGATTADVMTISALTVGGSLFTMLGGSAMTAGAFVIGQSTIQLAGGAPVVFIKDTASNIAFTAIPLVVRGSNNTGTSTSQSGLLDMRGGDSTAGTGGDLTARPGNGAVAQGTGRLNNGVGTQRFVWNATGIGFYQAAAIAQPTRVGQLTDNSTGTATGAVADVGVVYSQSGLNNIHASILAKLNGIESRLSQAASGLGLTA